MKNTRLILFACVIILTVSCQSNIYHESNIYYECYDLMDKNEYRKAIRCFNSKPIYKNNFYEFISQRGYCYHILHEYDSAIQDYKLALKDVPGDMFCTFNLGDIYFKQGNLMLAKQMFQQVYKSDNKYHNVNYNLGVIYFDEGKYDSAILSFDTEIKNNPNCAVCYFFKGQTLGNIGKDEDAIMVINKGLSLQKNAQAYFILGTIYFDLAEYEKAIQYHSISILMDSTDAEAFVKRSAAYGILGYYNEALEDCNKALSIDSLYIDALVSRKIAFQMLNREKEYIADSLKIIRLNKNH